ncbi:hypothetical protein K438DRAFT_1999921 [Mycena galopus ATCC 62051]|nr:hypothetical protein K438DRAFT_1999921 [Mycena galopus ATCC 62051]
MANSGKALVCLLRLRHLPLSPLQWNGSHSLVSPREAASFNSRPLSVVLALPSARSTPLAPRPSLRAHTALYTEARPSSLALIFKCNARGDADRRGAGLDAAPRRFAPCASLE